MDSLKSDEEWLKNHGTLFQNDVVDCTTNSGKYITVSWVPRLSHKNFIVKDAPTYQEAVHDVMQAVKDNLFSMMKEEINSK